MADIKKHLKVYVESEARKYLERPTLAIDEIMYIDAQQWHVFSRTSQSGVRYYVSSRINLGRLVQRLPVIHAFLSLIVEGGKSGDFTVSIGDKPGFAEPCISFSTSKMYDFLVPDPYFCRTNAYEAEKGNIAKSWIDIEDRKPVLFWRGGTTGDLLREDGRFPVVYDLNRFASTSIDVKFAVNSATLAKFIDEESQTGGVEPPLSIDREVLDKLTGERIPFIEFIKYRFHLDVDGNSNAWDSMFKKMLIGAPIFKIGHVFKQWYYDRLIESEATHWCLSPEDIVKRLTLALDDPAAAHAMGEAVRGFANQMTVRQELETVAERFPKRTSALYDLPYHAIARIEAAWAFDIETSVKTAGDIRSLSDNLYRNGFRKEALEVFAMTMDLFPVPENELKAYRSHLNRLQQRAEELAKTA
ncbi:MAG: hypothetical protein AAF291_06765 [Pseudomonadota bacterium]